MSDRTASGAARITKTKRVAYSVSADDISNGTVSVPVDFDNPFVDTNYTATLGIAATAPADPENYFAAGFVKRVDGVDVVVIIETGTAGDVVELNVHAIHD